jgi:hypothetical protein
MVATSPDRPYRPRNWSTWIVATVLLWSMAYGLFAGWLGHHVAGHRASELAGQPAVMPSACPF